MVGFRNAKLIEVKVPKNESGGANITFFSEDGYNMSFGKNYHETIPKIIKHGFSLVSESYTSLGAHMLYFQKMDNKTSYG